MANRLSKITTKQGDGGWTGLAGTTKRIPKSDPLMNLIGDVDELNCWIGAVICELAEKSNWKSYEDELAMIQHQLFNIGGELAMSQSDDYQELIKEDDIKALEVLIVRYNGNLPPLKDFVLPGSNQSNATIHIARAVCRRAERSAIANLEEGFSTQYVPKHVKYLNRLSDFLFVLARCHDFNPVLWDHKAAEMIKCAILKDST